MTSLQTNCILKKHDFLDEIFKYLSKHLFHVYYLHWDIKSKFSLKILRKDLQYKKLYYDRIS